MYDPYAVPCVFLMLPFSGRVGTVALYGASSDDVELIRALPNAVAPGDHLGPHVISVSADSLRLAFVGPSEHTVTVANARTLDEVGAVVAFLLDL